MTAAPISDNQATATSAPGIPAADDPVPAADDPAPAARAGEHAGADDAFAAERPRLLGLAYRITGGRADAEDVVQEAWLRWRHADRATLDSPGAWLTTVTTRLALDCLRTVRRRREVYTGPWLPDPVSTVRSPDDAAELAESLTVGFLVLLDRLGPVERAVLLLADVFGEPFAIVAEAVGKSEVACRQIATRARRKLRLADLAAARMHPAPAELLGALLTAVAAGDEEAAMALLAPDVQLVADAGPARRAARRPVVGPHRVHRLLRGGWRLFGFRSRPAPHDLPPIRLAIVNAGPALVADAPNGLVVISGEACQGAITRIWVRLNPAKTADLGRAVDLW